VTVTGIINGAGALTKGGAGTLTLTGSNTYAGGTTIAAGGRTVENWFRFSNAIVRMGFSQTAPLDQLHTSTLGFQLGVDVHSIRYRLEQLDRGQERRRFQNESWVEWAPTWGLSLTFPGLEVRYTGRTTHGTGRPGVAPQGIVAPPGTLEAASTRNILVAPNGPLTLDPVSVTTHQISLSVPIR
jgi:autotransporter-associated beta strand protein